MLAATRLRIAIEELTEAKRLAELFNWPQSEIDRIDLLKRGTANLLAKMLASGRETSDSASRQDADRVTGQPRVGPADRPEFNTGSTFDDITALVVGAQGEA